MNTPRQHGIGDVKMRLIDADALIKKFKHAKKGVKLGPMDIYAKGTLAGLDYAIYLINNVTTVEERKHGHWNNGYECSVCGVWMATDTIGDCLPAEEQHYCYNCGAKMDEVAEDEVRQNK